MGWGRIAWCSYSGKHRPDQKIPWKKQVDATKDGPAKYHPDIIVEQLELYVVEHEVVNSTIVLRVGRPILGEGNFKFVYHVNHRIVGASCGEETDIVRVQWDEEPTGALHGRPYTEMQLLAELKKKNPLEIEIYQRIRDRIKRGRL